MTDGDNQVNPAGRTERLIVQVSKLLHKEEPLVAGQVIADFQEEVTFEKTGQRIKLPQVVALSQAHDFCFQLLYWCLENDRYDLAASMLWSESLFTFEPRCTKMVWREIKGSFAVMLMGAGSMSKSYGAGVWLLLDWLRDPEYTTIKVVGPSEQHLKDNLFSHLVTFHRSATLPLPGFTRDLFIGLDSKERRSAITGVVFPIGQGKGGRLQGNKRFRRKEPHPKFGIQSRLRIMIDEFETVPKGVLKDIDNLFSNFDGDIEGLKLITAFNPEDITGPAAQRCEPMKGWENFDPENDELWDSKRGWRVVRLDAAKCENVEQKKIIYPGLQTWEGFKQIIKNAGGTDSPGYWTMARACFPKKGSVFSVLPPSQTAKLRGEFIFGEPPVAVGAVDIALEGGDIPEMTVGRFGKAIGYRLPPTPEHPKGKEFLFKNKKGQRVLRWAAQVDEQFALSPGDTVSVAESVKLAALKFGINPKNFIVDRTGNGAGVHDILKNTWSQEVRGLNYTESATEQKIIEEDTETPFKEFERVINEVWFALKRWAEYDFVKVSEKALTEDLLKELNGRRYKEGKNNQIETKRDYKSRGNSSPDKADSLTLFVHVIRIAMRCIPSALDGTTAGLSVFNRGPDDDEIVVRIDETNRFDSLDREPGGDGRDAYGQTFYVN